VARPCAGSAAGRHRPAAQRAMSAAGLGTVMAVASALVWALAAAGKAVRRTETAAAFAGLGLPRAPSLALTVPLVEALTAAALLWRPQVGALAGLVLLTFFSVVIVRALARGVETGCGCFGSRRPSALGPADVVRNGLLAAFLVVATGARHLTAPSAGDVVAGVAIVGVAAAVLGVAQRRTAPPARRTARPAPRARA
jgi:hypothetical protein